MTAVPVAITGMSLTCGLGSDLERIWQAVCAGESALRRRAELSGVFAACLPDTGDAADVIERAGRAAVRHAKLDVASVDPYRTGIALGTNSGAERLWNAYRSAGSATRPGHHPAHTCADQLGTALGLRGPKAVFATGCIAGAAAIAYAYDAVSSGRAAVMLAGGYESLNTTTVATFASWKAIDAAPCAPYARSSGMSLGEAVAFLVLESEQSARARGAEICAYVLGYGLAGDAFHVTAPPPDGSGLREAMHDALSHAGLDPEAVGYVNGHGTGTPANDTAELNAMRAVFSGSRKPPMSSSKAQLGHSLGACGAAEAVLTTLALRDQLLPPTANASAEDPAPWDIVPATARRAGFDVALSNSMAFGGASCSLVMGRRGAPVRELGTERLMITGAGVVSPLGNGREAFLTALRTGATDSGGDGAGAENAGRFVDAKYRPRLDGLGVLTVAAARMAWDDAGLGGAGDSGARVGIVLAGASGPIETVETLRSTVEDEGPGQVSALHAPNIVMSVPAGYAALELGMRGPLAAVSTGDASGLIALGHAADLIRRGQADAMIVVAADQATDTLTRAFAAYRPDARPPVSGAAAVVLEASGHAHARRARVLGELLGHAVTSGSEDTGDAGDHALSAEAWSEAVRLASADAGVPGGAVPLASTVSGHHQAATPLMTLVAALDGSGPALVTAASWGGTYAAAVVGTPRDGDA